MKTSQDLRRLLQSIDHRSYPAYKDTKGSYDFGGYILSIDHVQGDPFASPSNVSLRVKPQQAGFPKDFYAERHRRIALQDLLTRRFHDEAVHHSHRAGGSGKSGLIGVTRPGQEVLERTSCQIMASGEVVFRLEVGFPAFGRTINAGELIRILFEFLPACVDRALVYRMRERALYEDVLNLADDQRYIRQELEKRGLCAFVADGSILPRKSGVSDAPMKGAVAFRSPESVRVTMELPHGGTIAGMGIARGITLIVGGGYHGKSTLLKALERGVYDHIRGDGREYVITEASAVKIRSEDGRCVHRDDISVFINHLPNGRDTTAFSTEDASGSTSQAASVVEALECGTGTLLIDEDTCATNFMVRDALMQQVVNRDREPITPFIERMRPFHEELGVSCVMVAGSSGAFFGVADRVIQMDAYVPQDITAEAKEAYGQFFRDQRAAEVPAFRKPTFARVPMEIPGLRTADRVKVRVMGKDGFSLQFREGGGGSYREGGAGRRGPGGGYGRGRGGHGAPESPAQAPEQQAESGSGREDVDLRGVEQLVDREQTEAIAQLVRYAGQTLLDGRRSMGDILDALDEMLEKKGLSELSPYCGLAMPRRQEIAAALSRCRFLTIKGQ